MNQQQTRLNLLTLYGSCSHLSVHAQSTKTYGTLPYTMLRYAVTAPLRGACSFGVLANVCHLFMQHRRWTYAHKLLSSITFTLHGRKRRCVSVWMARTVCFWPSAVHEDIRNFALHNAPLRGDCPATRCMLFWGVCTCVPPFHATQEVSFCTRTFRFYHFDTACKKTFCLGRKDSVAWHNAPLRGDRPATRCMLFWGVCTCVPPFHATQEVNFCTRTFRFFHFDTACKKTTVCFCLDGKDSVLLAGTLYVCGWIM